MKNTRLILGLVFFVLVICLQTNISAQTNPRPAVPTMVRIPGGSFMMGSPENEPGRNSRNETQRQVTVSSFYMSIYPVTQREWIEMFGRVQQQPTEGLNLPVVELFGNVMLFLNSLSERHGLTPVYTVIRGHWVWEDRNANGYRLPTEAEWEYACRAGTTTAYNTGSNITNNTGWYNANSGGTMQAVGQLPANRFGLFDMHGNVWEWCWDWYHRYPTHAETNPTGPPGPIANAEVFISQRIVRGGTFQHPPEFMRSAHRSWFTPDRNASNMAGFRIVRNAQ